MPAGFIKLSHLLSGDPAERERLSRGAIERAREYLWTHQGEKMAAVYWRVLGVSPGERRERTFAPVFTTSEMPPPHWTAQPGPLQGRRGAWR